MNGNRRLNSGVIVKSVLKLWITSLIDVLCDIFEGGDSFHSVSVSVVEYV